MEQQPNLIMRYMRTADISEVVVIDEISFNPPWPERSYRFELNESNVSYMVVLQSPGERPVSGIWRLWHNIRGNGHQPTEPGHVIAGYGGLWKIAEEAHISTIATHPYYRGKKYGEILLAGMIRRSIMLQASYIVLEVRVSNQIAQNLYYKYGFEVQGIKREYYQYDQEDAYDMRLELTPSAIEHFNNRYEKLQRTISFLDDYSETLHPRLGR